jgi:hypothetical protein
VTRALDGRGQGTLVSSAGTRFATGIYLAPIRNIAAQFHGILVIYNGRFISAEAAHLALGDISASTLSLGSWFGIPFCNCVHILSNQKNFIFKPAG